MITVVELCWTMVADELGTRTFFAARGTILWTAKECREDEFTLFAGEKMVCCGTLAECKQRADRIVNLARQN